MRVAPPVDYFITHCTSVLVTCGPFIGADKAMVACITACNVNIQKAHSVNRVSHKELQIAFMIYSQDTGIWVAAGGKTMQVK